MYFAPKNSKTVNGGGGREEKREKEEKSN